MKTIVTMFNSFHSLKSILRYEIFVSGFLLSVIGIFILSKLSDIPKYWLFVFVLIAIVFILLANSKIIQQTSLHVFLITFIIIIFLIRIIWIFAIPTLPISDFGFFNSFAVQISQTNSFKMNETYMHMYMLGYPFILTIIYKIFGAYILLAKLLNILFSILTAIIFFFISKYLFGEYTARISIMLFSFWPSQIMLNSVLASENLYILLLMFGLFILIRELHDKSNDYNVLIAGIVLGLSYTVRAVSLVIIIISLIYLLFIQDSLLRKMKKVLLLGIGFVAVVGIYIIILSSLGIYGQSLLMAHSLIVGTNYDSKGMYNSQDDQILYAYSSEDANYMAFQLALLRITSNPVKFSDLVIEKFYIMWADDSYGTYWSTVKIKSSTAFSNFIEKNMTMLYTIPQLFYVWIIILAIFGCYKLRNVKINNGLSLLLLIFLTFVLLHSFLEVQPRYHYPFEFIFLMLTGYGIANVKFSSAGRYIENSTKERKYAINSEN